MSLVIILPLIDSLLERFLSYVCSIFGHHQPSSRAKIIGYLCCMGLTAVLSTVITVTNEWENANALSLHDFCLAYPSSISSTQLLVNVCFNLPPLLLICCTAEIDFKYLRALKKWGTDTIQGKKVQKDSSQVAVKNMCLTFGTLVIILFCGVVLCVSEAFHDKHLVVMSCWILLDIVKGPITIKLTFAANNR